MADPKEKWQRPPTERQVKFASAIAERLDIRLPRVRTRQSLFLFIRDNRPEFDRRKGYVPTVADADPDQDEAELLGLDVYTGALND